ncbi:MAG TPA: DUF58 domain-containing protein [Myxococcales bacterium]|nr:DUF58 domain-containing protein [Myxococcales bacterium]
MKPRSAAAHLRREAQTGRKLELVSRRAVAEVSSGRYRSQFKGRGNVFSEVRAYAPGDEVRTIDWNVTARTGVPHVKVFEEERELAVWLVVDLSGSSAYGSRHHSKAEAAGKIAACVAQAALSGGDRVGLIAFGEGRHVVVPPRKGRQQSIAIFEALAGAGDAAGARTLAGALKHLLELRRRPALVFVISDFDFDQSAADKRVLAAASRRFDLVPIVVRDSAEEQLPRGSGSVLLEDAETGERLLVDLSSARARATFAKHARGERALQEALFRGLRLDAIFLDPEADGARALALLMRRRALGRRAP